MANDLPSFERADYSTTGAPGTAQCARCGQTVTGRFFRLDGQVMCEPCANQAVSQPAEGAGAAFAKAIAVGLGAAIVGSILYAVVEIATGWTIGYVALAVGWLIGKGMKWGAEGRGGRRYQIAAALLTYLSVSFAGVVVVFHLSATRQPLGMHFILSRELGMFILKIGLLQPFLELQDGVRGIIGLFILFIGIRTAWALTAGSEYRITGPHSAGQSGVAPL